MSERNFFLYINLSFHCNVYKNDIVNLFFPFQITFYCHQDLHLVNIYYFVDIDCGKSRGKHGDSTSIIAEQKQLRTSWLITRVKKIFFVQLELTFSVVLAYVLFIDVIIDSHYYNVISEG